MSEIANGDEPEGRRVRDTCGLRGFQENRFEPKPRREGERDGAAFKRLLLASRADDATGNRKLVEQHQVKAGAVLVGPHGPDFAQYPLLPSFASFTT
jgi:hypothetical protein